ncbi:ferritin-like domain-containing protein (plasmid) [Paracoccus liaowanqingii]|uniref:Ferritin-like domain-containing protein n=2 Tax=Paracoccus liaowanqingii TaxID=2560053 RepID=A0A4Y5SVX0_9RHOB|nr:ferritin-like domain-containing protein [Paracoccus liaowanqingii]QDA37028.1 ferritin-like domain-containing protein [Paracoccus liaowanqingii]
MSAQDIFLDGLRNAHAMEKQALSIMQPQLNRLQHYPEMSALLDQHIRETETQIGRLEQILTSLDASSSGLKDLGLSMTGSMAALSHTLAGDEILKNTFANHAFENFEIAAYVSLITTADLCGAGEATVLLQQSLDEERHMASALHDSIDAVTRRYVTLAASDDRADI